MDIVLSAKTLSLKLLRKNRLFVVLYGYYHENQSGLELKIILPIENDEEPKNKLPAESRIDI